LYSTYGLKVESELELPELHYLKSSDSIQRHFSDVIVTRTPLPKKIKNAVFTDKRYFSDISLQISEECCQLNVEGIARYRVQKGKEILIDSCPRVPDSDVRTFLLGSTFGALLHQRGSFPLHVSAVATPEGVWAFTGPSGAGKSTLATILHQQLGLPLLSDDVGTISFEGNEAIFHPGPLRIKLWKNSIDYLGLQNQTSVRDLKRLNKFHLNIQGAFLSHSLPFKALVVLEKANAGEKSELTPLNGAQAFKALIQSVYRPRLSQYLKNSENIFRLCSDLAGSTKVYVFKRSWSLENLSDNLYPLTEQLGFVQV